MVDPVPLDIEQSDQLIAYLQQSARIGPDEWPAVRVLAGGVSNRTVLVKRPTGESWVLKQALAKLRVKVDWFSSPERIHREAEGLRWLTKLAPPETLPGFVFEDTEQHILAMEAIPEPHDNWKQMLLNGHLETDHIQQFGELLGMIHRRAYEERDQVAPAFEDRSFFESLRIEPYYSYTASQVPEAAGFLDRLIKDTRATRVTLVHGDYSPKNILVYRNRLILLDHEVIHFGDPAFDIGFSMAHLLSKAHHNPALRSGFADSAKLYWETYRQVLGEVIWIKSMENRAVRHTLACLLARVAGRSQLEYFNDEERSRQRNVVVALLVSETDNMADLIADFIKRLP